LSLALHAAKLLNFSFRRKDHPLTKVGDQLLLVVMAADFQEPKKGW